MLTTSHDALNNGLLNST